MKTRTVLRRDRRRNGEVDLSEGLIASAGGLAGSGDIGTADFAADVPAARGRRRYYLAGVAVTVIAAYTAFVLVNTAIVGFNTHVPFLPWLYLQDGLDIVAAAVLVLTAVVALDRLLERDQQRLVATLDALARVASLARRVGVAEEFRQHVRSIEQQSHEQVADLATTFGEMLSRLEQAVEMQRRFLADTSHELRNPLTSLSMNLALLQRDDLPPLVRQEAARDAHREAGRMQRLVTDLLLLARGDVAEMLQLEVVSLDELVESVANDASKAGRPAVTLGAVEPAIALGDSGRLRQAIGNVIENAQRFTPDSGTIRLDVRRLTGLDRGGREWAVITCTDTGTGIAPEHVPHVFERFYQADPSRSGGGSGLGLAIVKHLVEAHSGRVELASQLGKGTTVSMYLPLAQPDK
ncbi:MAG: hypothetical protein HY332_01845 [Chloroflexi bacterium]|nr:hypothetical protein [Chloroflexota bacterium]